ncbi:MAG: methylmalonyl-CoA mutase family protein [Acidimicrobiales bacterium]
MSVPHPDRRGLAHRPATGDQASPGWPRRRAASAAPRAAHRPSYDEALALPTEKAARIALRTQQIVAHETGVTNVVDPLGGAPFVEWMTDEMERQAEIVFAHLDELGGGSILEGVYAGIDNGWFVGEIADSAYRFEREVNAGRRIIVGVNEFTDGADATDANLLRIDQATEDYQRKRLDTVKRDRSQEAVDAALAAITAAAADPEINLMPSIIDAVRAYATEEEIARAMERVFGTYVETAIV